MLDEYDAALDNYMQAWNRLLIARKNRDFFVGLKPTAIGWKVRDRAEYTKRLADLHDQAAHIVETWMNGRWVAKVYLNNNNLDNGIKVIKIMQRRPDSMDAVGLDHVDFYVTPDNQVEEILTSENDLDWNYEENDILPGYGWRSIRFESREAKLKSDTVMEIVSIEMHNLSQEIIGIPDNNR